VAGHLCDLSTGEVLATAGMMNPQIRFGEDLMSRVSYVMMNPGGDKELTACIRTALNELINDLLRQADAPADELLDVVIVGNPIMHHIVLGIDPTPLGQAPFTLASAEAIRTTALDIGLEFPTARVRRAVHRRTCRRGYDRGHARRGPHRGEAWQCWSTSAPTPRSCWDAPSDSSLRPVPPARRSRAPRSRAASGRRRAQSSASASTGPRSPALKVIGSDLWSDDPASPRQPRIRDQRGVRLGHHRGDRRDVSLGSHRFRGRRARRDG
jgi:hypothetical protein